MAFTLTVFVNILVFTLVIAASFGSLAFWFTHDQALTALLDELTRCERSQSIPSKAERFAVFLATRKANTWVKMMRKCALTIPFIPIATIFLEWLPNLSVKVEDFLSAGHPKLYISLAVQAATLIYVLYIVHNVKAFRYEFVDKKPEPTTAVAAV